MPKWSKQVWTLLGSFGTPITPKVLKGFNTLYLFQKNIILRSSLVVNLEVGFHISVPNRVYKIAGLQVPDCDKIFFFFYFLQQILNKIDNYTPDMFPYTDEENDWISRT